MHVYVAPLPVVAQVTCVEKMGSPSTLIEDTALGLCLNIHSVPRVQCDCFVQNQRSSALSRCSAPISFHPVKSVRDYLGFTRMLAARAEHHFGVNISEARSRWAEFQRESGGAEPENATGATSTSSTVVPGLAKTECHYNSGGCFSPRVWG